MMPLSVKERMTWLAWPSKTTSTITMTSTSTSEQARSNRGRLIQAKTPRFTKWWCHSHQSAMTSSHCSEWWAQQPQNRKIPVRIWAAPTTLNSLIQARWLILKTTSTSAKTWALCKLQRSQMFSPVTVLTILECSNLQKAETRKLWLTLMQFMLWWTSTPSTRTNLVKIYCSAAEVLRK